jgi:hypothetical protein
MGVYEISYMGVKLNLLKFEENMTGARWAGLWLALGVG